MIRNYFDHLYCVVSANSDIKLGVGGGAVGGVSYKLGEVVGTNVVWEAIAHFGTVAGALVAVLALIRGVYSFKKELRQDRLKQLNRHPINSEQVEE